MLRVEVDTNVALYEDQKFEAFKIQLYVGEFKEGKRVGKGNLKLYKISEDDSNDSKNLFDNLEPYYEYQGEFVDNTKEGLGKESFFVDLEYYDGEFSDGKRQGKGNL
jgi:MORN repeat